MGKKRVTTFSEEEASKKAEGAQETAEQKIKKKKKGRMIKRAGIYVRASYNNTTVTVTDEDGNVITWSSAGAVGFKGPRKATPYAATQVVNVLLEKLEKFDIEKSELFVRGIGSGRDSAVRALSGVRDLNIVAIKDITPLPHNGCRPSKPKRN